MQECSRVLPEQHWYKIKCNYEPTVWGQIFDLVIILLARNDAFTFLYRSSNMPAHLCVHINYNMSSHNNNLKTNLYVIFISMFFWTLMERHVVGDNCLTNIHGDIIVLPYHGCKNRKERPKGVRHFPTGAVEGLDPAFVQKSDSYNRFLWEV